MIIDNLDTANNINKISIDMEHLAYKISFLEDEVARLSATIEEIKGENDGARRLVT